MYDKQTHLIHHHPLLVCKYLDQVTTSQTIFLSDQRINLIYTRVQFSSTSINKIIHTKFNHNMHLSIQKIILNKIMAMMSRKSN